MLRRRTDESGFTLIELVVTVAILGFVVVALTGVVFGYLRTSNETSTRLNESTDQQFISAYWQQDVSSLGMHGAPAGGSVPNSQGVYMGSAPGCAPALGSPIVMFTWNDYQNAPTANATLAWSTATQNYATYYTKSVTNANGSSQTQLWRKRCGGLSSDIVVARYLTAQPTVTCADSGGASTSCTGSGPFPATVSLNISVQDRSQVVHSNTGYSNLTITAERRQG
ncbi:MAG TPA: prepilin-type N-terminal cleavage/methylation domain-containing protein [Nocardioides sp.]|nr:prepilin-type N-terminal cleavage/methylation domain-containing protein [Nocardioides sp.]